MPVAQAGYCRLQDSFSCYLKCDIPKDCPGQEGTGAKANMPEGGCPAQMMKAFKDGSVQCLDAASGLR